ncbi:MAG: hypothetical protein FJX75_15675 [Armatimonadetes bacterium]|nr:hypothetical protein [Armatimonadota bacterium]
MASEGSGAHLIPPLPPSPMQSERPPLSFREVPLPWSALLLAAIAKLLSAGFVGGQASGYFASPVRLVVYSGISAAAGAAMALGAAIHDRLWPRWPRPLRWMIGMALPGFIPWHVLYALPSMVFGQPAPAVPGTLLLMADSVANGAVTGLALGLAAQRLDGLYLRMALAGLLAGLARTAMWVPVLLVSLRASGSSLQVLGAGYWGSLAVGQCAFGVLLALAIAACLSAAWRAKTGDSDSPPFS